MHIVVLPFFIFTCVIIISNCKTNGCTFFSLNNCFPQIKKYFIKFYFSLEQDILQSLWHCIGGTICEKNAKNNTVIIKFPKCANSSKLKDWVTSFNRFQKRTWHVSINIWGVAPGKRFRSICLNDKFNSSKNKILVL